MIRVVGKSILILLFLFLCVNRVCSQGTQTLRGKVFDEVTQYPISFAQVILLSNDTIVTQTDNNGLFRFDQVSFGRHTVLVRFIGYHDQVMSDILVTAGKEVVIEIPLVEKVSELTEIEIIAYNRAAGNEMTAVSGISFRPDDTRRFAGSMSDPSRMLANFAGVNSASDSRNDIVVRGNSPNGLLWRMEGLDIPNTNHYGALNSTGGSVSILNSNNIGKSDFYAGAFAAQYGNALSSVFDMTMRNGNTEKTEAILEVGFAGLEAGIEGPISTKNKSSYIINYRHSTLGIMSAAGLNFGTGTAVPYYQNLNFKIHIPLSEKTKLSFWGMGGPSRIDFVGNDADTTKGTTTISENENLRANYLTAIAGISLSTTFNQKTFGRFNIGASISQEKITEDSISIVTREAFHSMDLRKTANRAMTTYDLSHKFNVRNQLVAGINANFMNVNLYHKEISSGGLYEMLYLNQKDHLLLLKAYTQWKHRFSDELFITAGLHYQTLTMNKTSAFEPRAGIHYSISPKHSISAGYGLHSQMQYPEVYFFRSYTPQGEAQLTNKNLGFTQSHHYVLGYNYKLAADIRFRTEVYYQALQNVPVTTIPSGFSSLNIGGIFNTPYRANLVNNGFGKNYGIELTIEKYFSKNYYFLITGSLYESKYKGSDGIERNTAFNSNYAYNVLLGKDFVFKGGTISANFNISAIGGRYTSPIDMEASLARGNTVYDEYNNPFSIRLKNYFRGDVKVGYKKDFRKATYETGIEIRNFTNRQNLFVQVYNRRTNSIVDETQQGILPIPYVRFTF